MKTGASKGLRLAKSALNDNIYVGHLNADGITWRDKTDVTGDFLRAVVERWNGFQETIGCTNGKRYTVFVMEAGGTQKGAMKSSDKIGA